MKGSILIIGSLLWDNHQGQHQNARRDWRSARLKMADKIHVAVPIRYGRLSGGAHTMVLSKQLELGENLGTAYVIPCKKDISTYTGLYNQAKYLSNAEGRNDSNLVKGNNEKWCVIGIMFNPNFNPARRNELLKLYQDQLIADGLGNEHANFRVGAEQSILSAQGEININWLRTIDPQMQQKLNDLDFILSACPWQNIGFYPTPQQIRQTALADQRRYFFTNIINGITTYQDREIVGL